MRHRQLSLCIMCARIVRLRDGRIPQGVPRAPPATLCCTFYLLSLVVVSSLGAVIGFEPLCYEP